MSKVKFKAVGSNVVLERRRSAEKSGDIYIPDTIKFDEYTIYDVGPSCEEKWEIGENVIIDKFNSQQFKSSNGDELIVIQEDKIRVRIK